jgi:hypothetical protein
MSIRSTCSSSLNNTMTGRELVCMKFLEGSIWGKNPDPMHYTLNTQPYLDIGLLRRLKVQSLKRSAKTNTVHAFFQRLATN